MDIASPRDLVEQLVRIFPAFQNLWDEGEAFGYDGDYSFHSVFMTFASESYKFLNGATPDQIGEFSGLISRLVEKGGNYENAVSTCFLEHASQLRIRKLIERYLSAEARNQLR